MRKKLNKIQCDLLLLFIVEFGTKCNHKQWSDSKARHYWCDNKKLDDIVWGYVLNYTINPSEVWITDEALEQYKKQVATCEN